jgi:pSer/pThr/pTyr-binding forkhead associated (FHA) protein
MDLPDAPHRSTAAELQARIAAERGDRPFLVMRDDRGAQRVIELADAPGRMTIGRELASDVAIEWDGEVSRLHALLERINEEWTLVDDGRARNGSYLNGRRVHGRSLLRGGDVIRVGRTSIVFRAPAGREGSETATAADDPVPMLTDAQRRVLIALCRPSAGSAFAAPASTRQIADELVVSVETVKTHLRALFTLFGVGDLPQNQKRAELARRAMTLGAVDPVDLLSSP